MTAIKGFAGPFRYLSNFFIEPDGSHVEGEYQRAKCAEAHQRAWFHELEDSMCLSQLKPPAQCKAIGRKAVKLRADWEDVKIDIMLFHVRKKFKDHPTLAMDLTLTGDRYLEETNHWGDTFWGVCGGKGQNMLGAILMQVRDEL